MQIELEKKYNLTKEDYKIIRDKFEYIKDIDLKDYYLDKDLILLKNKHYLRLRNGLYELKIINFNPETQLVSSEEYEDEDEINKCLEKFNLTIDDCTWIIFIDTKREKYKHIFNWYEINIDVEEYQYNTRYELEIVYQEENIQNREIKEKELNNLLENFRKEFWLTAISDVNASKFITCAMYQNIEIYELLTENNLWK